MFNNWIDKKDLVGFYHIKISQFFPKPLKIFGKNINVKVDISNYATKADIKNISHVDTSSFASKTNLANLKTEVDKLDIDKLVSVPTDLSKLSNVVKNDVVKKDVYDKLVAKVNNIDTSEFVLKTMYDTYKSELGITKPYTQLHPAPPSFIHLHPAPSTSAHLISASTQLSATPSTIFEPEYCT